MESHQGKCPCGNVTVKITLPDDLSSYHPRACDCDFCTARDISYLSNPAGLLVITTDVPLTAQKQGSNQASFITCSSCQTVIAASLQQDTVFIGALNATLLFDVSKLGTPARVSPKLLNAKKLITFC
ncbi:aldehyde-activating protein [Thalassotalea fusca]